MNSLTTLITFSSAALLFILNYEFFYINAEGIFILSFLLFSFAFYYFAGDAIGSLLDETSQDISKKIQEVTKLQKATLAENKKILESLKKTQTKMVALLVLVVYIIEQKEEQELQAQGRALRNFFEKKLKVIVLENSAVTGSFSYKAAKDIMDLYEKKLKK